MLSGPHILQARAPRVATILPLLVVRGSFACQRQRQRCTDAVLCRSLGPPSSVRPAVRRFVSHQGCCFPGAWKLLFSFAFQNHFISRLSPAYVVVVVTTFPHLSLGASLQHRSVSVLVGSSSKHHNHDVFQSLCACARACLRPSVRVRLRKGQKGTHFPEAAADTLATATLHLPGSQSQSLRFNECVLLK